MIVIRTVGGDLCKAELQVGLVLKAHDEETPEALGGNGRSLFAIVHASDEERTLLRQFGVEIDDVDFTNLETHRRQLPDNERTRINASLRRTAKRARASARRRSEATAEPIPGEPITALAA